MLRLRHTRIAQLTALAATALIATACAGTPPADEPAGAGSASSDGSASTTGGDKKPLIISLDSSVDLLDPQAWRTPAAMAATTGLADMLLEQDYKPKEGGLVLAGQAKFSPALAESVEYSSDGKTATFKLRKDLKFADGSPLTAKDIMWTYQRSMLGPGYVHAFLPFVGVEKPEQITAPTDQTLVITGALTKSPLFAKFIGMQVLGAMSQKSGDEHKAANDEWAGKWFAENANSSGAYVVKSYDKNTALELTPNPNYYDQSRLHNSGVTIQFVPDPSQRALLLRDGTIDLAQGLPPDQLQTLEKDPALNVINEPSNRLAYLGMNVGQAPFNNEKVRQAIAAAVPYQALVDQAMKGYARKATGVIPSNMDTFDAAASGSFTEDLDKAKKLLEESGVALPINTTLYVRQSNSTDRSSAVFIQSNLKKIGIDLAIKPLPDAEFTQRSNARELPFYILQYLGWGADPFYQVFYLAGSTAGTNFTTYANPALDKLVAEGLKATDEATRKEVSRQMQSTLAKDMPVVPLFNPNWTFAVRKGVTGLAQDNTEQLRLQYLSKK